MWLKEVMTHSYLENYKREPVDKLLKLNADLYGIHNYSTEDIHTLLLSGGGRHN